MGPRLGSRGNALALGVTTADNPASMGPRLGSRGNMATVRKDGKSDWLQWGRGWVAAETLDQGFSELIEGASMGPRLGSRGNGGCGLPPKWA